MSLTPPLPIVPASEDEAQRLEHLYARTDGPSRRWQLVFLGGWFVLGVCAVFAMAGWPGSGIVLLPIGLGMLVGSGVQLLIDHIAA